MNRADTIARTTLLGATGASPVVASADVDTIVDMHAMVDVNGAAPGSTGWVETYDVYAAVAEVWRVKAAACAGDFSFTADDASYSKGDVLAHCLDMEAKYQAMAGSQSGEGTTNAGTVQVGGSLRGYANQWQDRDVAMWTDRVVP